MNFFLDLISPFVSTFIFRSFNKLKSFRLSLFFSYFLLKKEARKEHFAISFVKYFDCFKK